jgi:hypothetical protein
LDCAVTYSKGQCETSEPQPYGNVRREIGETSVKIVKVVAALPIAPTVPDLIIKRITISIFFS